MSLNIYILTLFKEFFQTPIENSLIKKAVDLEKLNISFVNIRDFAKDNYGTVDDEVYGGGPGMLLKTEPAFKAFESIEKKLNNNTLKIYMSPKGRVLDQKLCEELLRYDNIVILSARYEGIDQRIIDEKIDLELSVGDYILPDGESATLILLGCISRLLDGVVGKKDSITDDSITIGRLEAPHYTRPEKFNNLEVPKILLSGNHKEIEKWRTKKSLELTYLRRPDLLLRNKLSNVEKNLLKEIYVESIKKRKN